MSIFLVTSVNSCGKRQCYTGTCVGHFHSRTKADNCKEYGKGESVVCAFRLIKGYVLNIGMGRTWQILARFCLLCGGYLVSQAFAHNDRFQKVEPNNGNHSGNCQCLSALQEKRYTREVQF